MPETEGLTGLQKEPLLTPMEEWQLPALSLEPLLWFEVRLLRQGELYQVMYTLAM